MSDMLKWGRGGDFSNAPFSHVCLRELEVPGAVPRRRRQQYDFTNSVAPWNVWARVQSEENFLRHFTERGTMNEWMVDTGIDWPMFLANPPVAAPGPAPENDLLPPPLAADPITGGNATASGPAPGNRAHLAMGSNATAFPAPRPVSSNVPSTMVNNQATAAARPSMNGGNTNTLPAARSSAAGPPPMKKRKTTAFVAAPSAPAPAPPMNRGNTNTLPAPGPSAPPMSGGNTTTLPAARSSAAAPPPMKKRKTTTPAAARSAPAPPSPMDRGNTTTLTAARPSTAAPRPPPASAYVPKVYVKGATGAERNKARMAAGGAARGRKIGSKTRPKDEFGRRVGPSGPNTPVTPFGGHGKMDAFPRRKDDDAAGGAGGAEGGIAA